MGSNLLMGIFHMLVYEVFCVQKCVLAISDWDSYLSRENFALSI